jgi:hypothetical protein
MDMGTPGITLASRLKKILPPGVADDPIKQGQQVSPEQLKAIIGDMQKLMAENQMHTEQKQQMGQLIAQLQKEVKDKSAEHQLEMDKTVIKASTELQKAKMEHEHANQHKAVDVALSLHQAASQPRPAVSKSNKGA